jgi:hypothetical protein
VGSHECDYLSTLDPDSVESDDQIAWICMLARFSFCKIHGVTSELLGFDATPVGVGAVEYLQEYTMGDEKDEKESSERVDVDADQVMEKLGGYIAEAGMTREDVVHLLKVIRCNAHAIAEIPKTDIVGCGLFPLASFVNHSCVPNSLWKIDERGCLSFKALCNIPAGTPITLTYGQAYEFRPQRRLLLKNSNGFWCRCDLCSHSLRTLDLGEQIYGGADVSRMDELFSAIDEMAEEGEGEKSEDFDTIGGGITSIGRGEFIQLEKNLSAMRCRCGHRIDVALDRSVFRSRDCIIKCPQCGFERTANEYYEIMKKLSHDSCAIMEESTSDFTNAKTWDEVVEFVGKVENLFNELQSKLWRTHSELIRMHAFLHSLLVASDRVEEGISMLPEMMDHYDALSFQMWKDKDYLVVPSLAYQGTLLCMGLVKSRKMELSTAMHIVEQGLMHAHRAREGLSFVFGPDHWILHRLGHYASWLEAMINFLIKKKKNP